MKLENYLPKAKKVLQRKPDLFKTLTPRQEKCLRMRLGLGQTEAAYSYTDIGNHYAVSREQARNIIADAIVHLGLNILADESDE